MLPDIEPIISYLESVIHVIKRFLDYKFLEDKCIKLKVHQTGRRPQSSLEDLSKDFGSYTHRSPAFHDITLVLPSFDSNYPISLFRRWVHPNDAHFRESSLIVLVQTPIIPCTFTLKANEAGRPWDEGQMLLHPNVLKKQFCTLDIMLPEIECIQLNQHCFRYVELHSVGKWSLYWPFLSNFPTPKVGHRDLDPWY